CESIVMRLLQRASVFHPLEKLGFPTDTLKRFERLIKRPHGILLVTGPTGSGKTTTLYAALDKINSPGVKIITVEDPVEYQLKGVNQIPVKPKIGLTFATGLRHIVRQDPDVILIGEIRDLETAEIAIQAALTGHLAISTLHTNDAPGAITRLQDMGVEAYLVASVLEGVLAQRLVRRICQACLTPDTPNAADLEALGIEGAAGTKLWRGGGCAGCRGTGYRGRTGIYELFPITEDARSLILRRAPNRDIRRQAIDDGMVTLRLDGWRKACDDVTTVEELLRVTRAAARPRGRHGGAAGAAPARQGARRRPARERARRLVAQRGAGQAPPAPVLAPLHQHGPRRREGRRPRGHAPTPRRVPRGPRRL